MVLLPLWFPFRDRSVLRTIAGHALLTFSHSEHDYFYRKRAIEELICYKPDHISKEVQYNIYGRFDDLLNRLETKIQYMVTDEMVRRLKRKRSAYFRQSGRISWKGQKYLVEDFSYFPKPFVKRLTRRVGYLRLDRAAMQDDYRKLEQILNLLRNKGCLVEPSESIYYRYIKMEEILAVYQEVRNHPHYQQVMLERLDIVTRSYSKTEGPNGIHPISKEKKIAQHKKFFANYLNLYAWNLDPEKKRDFTRVLINNEIDLQPGREIIKQLSEKLTYQLYSDARDEIVGSMSLRQIPDRTMLGVAIDRNGRLPSGKKKDKS